MFLGANFSTRAFPRGATRGVLGVQLHMGAQGLGAPSGPEYGTEKFPPLFIFTFHYVIVKFINHVTTGKKYSIFL